MAAIRTEVFIVIRAGIRWWLMVTAEDPVRRVLGQACAAIVTLCLLITIATLAALFLGGATTRGFLLIPAVPVWIIAWRINRRGSPFGAALMSYMLIPLREVTIVRMLSEGAATREIGAALGLSEHRVKQCIGDILERLGANDRAHAVAIALRAGLI